MKAIGYATKAMFNALARESWQRARKWFETHKDCTHAYWAKDDFLDCNASDKEKELFILAHPEIEDLNDHTIIHWEQDTLVLDHFCPRLKAGIKDFYESGYCCGDSWTVEPDDSNYKLFIK